MRYQGAEKTGDLESIRERKLLRNPLSVCFYCLWENRAGDVWNREVADSCLNFMAANVPRIGNLNITYKLGMVLGFARIIYWEVNTLVIENYSLQSQIWVQILALSFPSCVTSDRWLSLSVPQFLICHMRKRIILTVRFAVGTQWDNYLKFFF